MGRLGGDRMVLKFTSITNKVVSSISAHCEIYSIQQYVIKFVSDLRQVNGYFLILWVSPPKQLTATI